MKFSRNSKLWLWVLMVGLSVIVIVVASMNLLSGV